MNPRTARPLIAAALALLVAGLGAQDGGCLQCHPASAPAPGDAHASLAGACVPCHRGDGNAREQQVAHAGLVPFPGDLANASETCGACHEAYARSVLTSPMATGRGVVAVTREVLGEADEEARPADLARLGHSPADTLLRKRCASCHLGQSKTRHSLDPVRDRGGGCLACHLAGYPEGRHPRLSAVVDDARCFGCHARSGRISLNYVGLGEVEEARTAGDTLSLADGRRLERRPADVHQRAGMGCVDCHTVADTMGYPGSGESRGVDIRCTDCHANGRPRLRLADWPAALDGLRRRIPFATAPDQPFLVTGRGTPLWNLEIAGDDLWLHRKDGGGRLRIPLHSAASHTLAESHARLTCDACHAAWAPQCYGCHIHFEPADTQWDYAERRYTPGAWHERRWDVRNEAPPLGVHGDRITVFVPGMVMSADHPDWPRTRTWRRFAPLSPHTTGRARSCAGCHRSGVALGLGRGSLARDDKGWRFTPTSPPGPDGRPADAWATLSQAGAGADPDSRPLSPGELERALNALDGL